MHQPSFPARFSRLDLLLTILLVIGAALRSTTWDAREFWHDELYSLFSAAGLTPFGHGAAAEFRHADLVALNTFDQVTQASLRNDGGNGILHSWCMHVWMLFAPHTTTWLRLPSALLGLAAIALIMAMAHDLLGGRRPALMAGVLAAWNVLLLQSSLELRGYTLAAVLSILSTWAFLRNLLHPPRGMRSHVVYAGCALLGLLAHYSTVYVLLAHGMILLFLARDRHTWRAAIAGAVVVICGMAVWMSMGGAEGYAVIAARNAEYTAQVKADPQINSFFQATRPSTLVEGIGVQALWVSGNGLQYAGPQLRYILLLLVIPGWLFWSAWRRPPSPSARRLGLALVILAIAPMLYATLLAISAGHTVSFLPRYALFGLPGWCLIMTLGAMARPALTGPARLGPGPIAAVLAIVIAMSSVVLMLSPRDQRIIGPDQYHRYRSLIGASVQATQHCAPSIVHGTYTSAFLVNLMAWDPAWNDVQQRVDPDRAFYTAVDPGAPCSAGPVVVIEKDGRYPRSEPKDPTDDATW